MLSQSETTVKRKIEMTEENLLSIANYLPFVLIGIVALFWLFRFSVARRWNQHKAETVGRWEAEEVEFVRGPVGGQFAGLESTGVNRVIRGIGFAVMTDKDLRVTRATPSGTWCVTYKQIKGITIQPSFLGHTGKKAPIIVVRFVKDGKKDKLGFQVKDFEAWAEDLAEAAGVSLKDQR
jgi:hypothetical protein